MAKTLQTIAHAGLGTPTAELFAIGSDTIVETITLTEATNRNGTYTGTITAAAGNYEVKVFGGAVLSATWFLTVGAADPATYRTTDETSVAIIGTEAVAQINAAITEVIVTASVQSAAGSALDVSVWLKRGGAAVDLTGATCDVTVREISSDTDLLTMDETDVFPAKTATRNNIFRLTYANPGFTDDRQYVVIAAVTIGATTWTTPDVIPVLGG